MVAIITGRVPERPKVCTAPAPPPHRHALQGALKRQSVHGVGDLGVRVVALKRGEKCESNTKKKIANSCKPCSFAVSACNFHENCCFFHCQCAKIFLLLLRGKSAL